MRTASRNIKKEFLIIRVPRDRQQTVIQIILMVKDAVPLVSHVFYSWLVMYNCTTIFCQDKIVIVLDLCGILTTKQFSILSEC